MLLALSCCVAAWADDSDLDEELRYLQAEAEAGKFVITATRTLESIGKSGATVTVVTRDQIKDMGARHVMDVLATVPGLGVTQNNIGTYEIEARGIKTPVHEKVLFMLDSHPANGGRGSALEGYGGILIENVSRVEVVRGPGSALYGANAFLTVINVITRNHEIDAIELTTRGGSYESQQYNLFVGKELGDLGLTLNLNYLDTNGQDEFLEADSVGAAGNILFWKEKWDLDLKLAMGDIGLHGRIARRENGPYVGIVNALNDESDQQYTDAFVEGNYDYQFSESLRLEVRAYWDYFQIDNYWELYQEDFDPGAFPDGLLTRSAVNNSKVGIDAAAHYDVSESNKLILGIWREQQRQSDVEFETNFDPLTFAPLAGGFQKLSEDVDWTKEVIRDVWAVYAEDIWDISDELRLILGVRFDHCLVVGRTMNPRTSLMWEFTDGYSLKVSYGAAFRDPSFAQLLNQNSNPASLGNPKLSQEEIDTYEVGITGNVTEDLTMRVTGFYNEIENLVVPIAAPNTATLYDNAGKIEVIGVESEFRWNFDDDGSYLSANHTYQDTENEDGSRVADTPAQRGTIMLNVALPNDINWHTQWLLKDETPRSVGDTRSDGSGYGLVNSTLRFEDLLGQDGLELSASVYNLFDEDYDDPSPAGTTTDDFPKPGRTYWVAVSYLF
jgi:outer membrane receptor for ferrienterochelin and colicin